MAVAIAMAMPWLYMATAQGESAGFTQSSAQRNPDRYRASKIIGAPIRDPRNNQLGIIRDIVLGSDRGEIAYVIATFGGNADKEKYHAIPWKAMQPSDDGKYYVLNADRETVVKSPAFDRRKWPDMSDREWNAEINRYWDRMVGQASSERISPDSGANSATGSSGAGR